MDIYLDYITVTEKVKVDPKEIAKAKADKAKRKRDKKRLNKIIEKKRKEDELKNIMQSLEESAKQEEDNKVTIIEIIASNIKTFPLSACLHWQSYMIG